jgi:hypothetical protein
MAPKPCYFYYLNGITWLDLVDMWFQQGWFPLVLLRYIALQRGTISGYLEVLGGDPQCTRRNQPPYQINIPAAPVYHQSAIGIPQAVAGGFDIDLFKVQQRCS